MSTNTSPADASSSPPAPLQDRTNAPVDPVITDEELEAKNQEIARLQSLIHGFTKGSGRGRKKRVRDEDDATSEPSSKKSKPETDYVVYGQTIGRLLGPFVNIGLVIEHGCTMDTAMSGDEADPDPKLDRAWRILCLKFPGFHEYMLELSRKPVIRRAIAKQIATGMDSVRSADTANLKRIIPRLLYKDPTTPLDPPLPNLTSKAHRGMAHPEFAKALTPIEWDAVASTYLDIDGGDKQLTADKLPRFIFPLDQEFPVGTKSDDPAWVPVFDNALKGEILLRSAKAIYMGPDAALEGDGFHKGRPGNASIIGMTTFDSRAIAGLCTQVYFALSSKQEWGKTDGDFDYEDFFWTIHGLFDDEVWGQGIIDLWNKVVLGTSSKPKPAATAGEAGPSHLQQMKAARAALRAAEAEPAPTPTVVETPAPTAVEITAPATVETPAAGASTTA
ncbi:hypothetical protein B0H11DRAFT_1931747 [Mycena galericulata]|nr:hypothetical protein B0H11DRAFT_1931747 [Mycena galericulata]